MDQKALNELNATVQPMGVLEHRKLLRALFYADTGMGKTSLAVHCVENKGLMITNDSAWSVIERYPDIAPLWKRVRFEGFSQVRAIAEAHSEGIGEWAEYDTLLWDPCSASVNKMLRIVSSSQDREVEEWPDYRKVERYLTDTVDTLNATDMNIIYTAHLRFPTESDAKNKGLYAVRPSMPEASYNAIAREVQLIGYMFREGVGEKRKIQFQPTKRVTAKTQIPTINEGIYNSSEIPELIRKWKNV
jgi:phage nucleotide-binding protein